MAKQKEEGESSIVNVHNGEDSSGQESFQTCGNDKNAQNETEQETTKPLNLGEMTCAGININGDQSTKVRAIPSFIKVGLDKKQTPRAIKSWAALALTLDGRDKITKVLQYISRFLGWYLAGSTLKNQSLRFTDLYKALAQSRKAFRLGRSLIELEKLRAVPGMIVWHLQSEEEDQGSKSIESKRVLMDPASLSIGLGPLTIAEEQESRRSFLCSISRVAYQRMYRPLLSRIASTMLPEDTPNQELWKICGMSIKTMGLLLFWAGDNCNFLLSTGTFDDYNIPKEERIKRRKKAQAYFSTRASQAYFVGSLAGLMVNWYAYLKFHRESIVCLRDENNDAIDEDTENWTRKVKQLKQKQFSLFLSLLKSCCDVTVFSNQPGVDLHKKWRGKKNHEGIHCICGLISAGTVIYNNFPDSK